MKSFSFNILLRSNLNTYKLDETSMQGNLLVDLQTNDVFLIATIMRLSIALSKSLNCNIVVYPSVKTTSAAISLIKSYSPSKIENSKMLVIKAFLKNFKIIICNLFRLKSGKDLVDLVLDGHAIGVPIYDSLLRRMSLPTIDKLSIKQKMFICLELSYYHSMIIFIKTNSIDYAILADDVYRQGIAREIFKNNNIPSVAGIGVNGFSMHRYDTTQDYEDHCRTPDYDLVYKIYNSDKLYSNVTKYLDHRFSGNEQQHDLIRAYAKNKREISKSEVYKEYNLDSTKKTVLVMSHIFCDAPHAYPEMLFQDYLEWLELTCINLNQNNSVNFLVKEHPSVDLYGEQGVIESVLSRHGLENKLLSKDINTKALFKCVDVLVTCGGTAGAEFPCFGVPVVVASKPPYSGLQYVYTSETPDDYFRVLLDIHNIDAMNDNDIRLAQCVMYYMYVIMRVDKAKLGFGSQIFSMDNDINYEVFVDEMVNANNKLITDSFYQVIDEFMKSKYKNLNSYYLLGS